MKTVSLTRLFGRRFASEAQRLVAVAALLGFLGGVIGVPLPKLRLAKDRSKPFPCQNHHCGCASAEQCWRSCCCFTNQEKLAWAATRGVQAPDYVVLAASREKPVSKASSCCQVAAKACCTHDEACSDEAKHVHDGDVDTDEHDETASASWSIELVLMVQARRCQGQAELWLALGAIAPPPVKVDIRIEQPVENLPAIAANFLAGISHQPAAPPPRV